MTKSTQNRVLVLTLILVAFGIGTLTAQQEPDQERDPVLDYYWTGAKRVSEQHDPTTAGLAYSLATHSLIHRIDSRGEITATDTVVAEFSFSDGALDTCRFVDGNQEALERIDISYPDIFDYAYHIHFYPNDTGGENLPIGMVADSTSPGTPDGLLVIDRSEKYPRRLYLHYPDKEGFRRFSRILWFEVQDGFIFPDSVVEIGVKLGFIGSETYRIETDITNITIESR